MTSKIYINQIYTHHNYSGTTKNMVLNIDPYCCCRLLAKLGSGKKLRVSPVTGKPNLPGGKGREVID
jgi:hypothetical protein